jgi:hypothetical protein
MVETDCEQAVWSWRINTMRTSLTSGSGRVPVPLPFLAVIHVDN